MGLAVFLAFFFFFFFEAPACSPVPVSSAVGEGDEEREEWDDGGVGSKTVGLTREGRSASAHIVSAVSQG